MARSRWFLILLAALFSLAAHSASRAAPAPSPTTSVSPPGEATWSGRVGLEQDAHLTAVRDANITEGTAINPLDRPIDRPVAGGVMRKDPGSGSFHFVPGLTNEQMKARNKERREALLREHGDEPRQIVIDAATADVIARAARAGISLPSGSSGPTTVTVRYRDLPRLREEGVEFKSATVLPAAAAPPPPQPQINEAEATTQLWFDGFESNFSSNWYSIDWDSYNGYDTWGPQALPSCGYVYSGGYSAGCAASRDYGDPLCPANYDLYQESYLERYNDFNMTNYGSYDANYYVWCQTEYSYDDVEFYYYTSGSGWIFITSRTGSNAYWEHLGTPVIINNSHLADTFNVRFLFNSDYSVTSVGVWVDNVEFRGTLSKPNLTACLSPPGYAGPIVPNMTPGTGTYGPLLGDQPNLYVDYSVRNIGDAGTGANVKVNFFIDNLPFASGYDYVYGGLNQNECRTIADHYFPGLSSGPHTLKMIIDPDNTIDETIETDNTYTQTFTWTAPTVDLVIDNVTYTPASPKAGDPVTYNVTVRNAGNGAINNQLFWVAWYDNRASAPTTANPGDIESPIWFLGPGATTTVSFVRTASTVGTWHSYAYVDRTNNIIETNPPLNTAESNNAYGPVTTTFAAGVLSLTGQVVFDDPFDGVNQPLGCVKVTAWDSDAGGPRLLGTAYTDATGNFSFTNITNDDTDHSFLDPYIEVSLESGDACLGGPGVKVIDAFEAIHFFDGPVLTNASNGPHALGAIEPADYRHQAASRIYQKALTARAWSRTQLAGISTPLVSVKWDDGFAQKTEYAGASATIRLSGERNPSIYKPDEIDDSAIFHEYGHHVAGANGFTTLVGDITTHSLDQEIILNGVPSPQRAWTEGWADFCAAADYGDGRTYFEDYGFSQPTDAIKPHTHFDLENGVYSHGSTNEDVGSDGPTWEATVAATLWDLSDPSESSTYGGCLDLFGGDVPAVFTGASGHAGSPIPDVLQYYFAFRSHYPLPVVNRFPWMQIGGVFCYHNIDPFQCAFLHGTKGISTCPGGDGAPLAFHTYLNGNCDGLDLSGTSPIYYLATDQTTPGVTMWSGGTAASAPLTRLDPLSYTAATRDAQFQLNRVTGCGDLYLQLYVGSDPVGTAQRFNIHSYDQDASAPGAVDSYDEAKLLTQLGSTTDFCGDFDRSGLINTNDLSLFLAHRGHHINRQLYFPNGGEFFSGGSTMAINWAAGGGTAGKVTLYLLHDSSPSFRFVIAQDVPDNGLYNWVVTNGGNYATDCRIEVVHTAGLMADSPYDIGRDQSDFTFRLGSTGGGGCPVADVLTDAGWSYDNSLLGRSLDLKFSPDLHALSVRPSAADGRYHLRLRENAQEHTLLDRVELKVVDHAPGVSAVVVDGAIMLGQRAPVGRVTASGGRDVTHLLTDEDGITFTGMPGETLLIEAAPAGSGFRKDRIVTSDLVKIPDETYRAQHVGGEDSHERLDAIPLNRSGYFVQARGEAGEWQTVTRRYPRDRTSENVTVSPTATEWRIIFVGLHRLDAIRRFVPAEEAARVQTVAPLQARTDEGADLLPTLGHASGGVAVMSPGDSILLDFEAPPEQPGTEREVFLLVNGVYTSDPLPGGEPPASVRVPLAFGVSQNRPNPFSRATEIALALPTSRPTRIEVFDPLGRRIRTLVNQTLAAGEHRILWDAADESGTRVRPGIYLYRVRAGADVVTRRMVVLP